MLNIVSLIVYSTISPIRISHAVTLKVFYSLRGLTLQNEAIQGDDQSGDLRMLVIPVSVRLPSVRHVRIGKLRFTANRPIDQCMCIVERVKLPECESLKFAEVRQKMH